jgi:hypothetical protein
MAFEWLWKLCGWGQGRDIEDLKASNRDLQEFVKL